jgi:4-hydroxybenzoate polyprenyltransferase
MSRSELLLQGVPAENPAIAPAAGFLRKCATILQTLSIYGALGIVSFGWALSRLLHFDCARYVPLWFCSALFIYNLDRLKADPADLINTPARSRSAASLRKASRALAAISGVALVVVPLLERDWLMLLLTTGGAFVCMNYSVPMLGFRFKDVPFLKSFFAPALVTAAFVIPPLLQHPLRVAPACYAAAAAWTLCVTLFNMILCDLRDIEGDARTGIRSLPVALGRRRTIRALAALVALAALFSSAAIFASSPAFVTPWTFISVVMTVYLTALLAAVHKPRPESFYEWWVEGILLVPALIYTITL